MAGLDGPARRAGWPTLAGRRQIVTTSSKASEAAPRCVAVLTHSDFGPPRRQRSGLPRSVRGYFDSLLGAVGVTGRDTCSLSTEFAPSSRNCTQKAGLIHVIHVPEHDRRGRGHARWRKGPN